MHYYEEESHFYHTLFDFKSIVDMYGDRVFDELEKHCPDLYEAWAAHKANKDVEEFLDSQYQSNYNDDCDYWKDEGEYND